MVIDARLVNQSHRTPPHVALGSPSAWADINLADLPDLPSAPPPDADHEQGSLDDGVPEGSDLFFASGDLQDWHRLP